MGALQGVDGHWYLPHPTRSGSLASLRLAIVFTGQENRRRDIASSSDAIGNDRLNSNTDRAALSASWRYFWVPRRSELDIHLANLLAHHFFFH